MSNAESIQGFMNAISNMQAYDVSPLLDTNLPGWHTHPTLGIIRDGRNFDHNGYFAQTLVISEHTGSHVDAPGHVLPGRETIETFPSTTSWGLIRSTT